MNSSEMKKAERRFTSIEKPLAVVRHMHNLDHQESWLNLIALIPFIFFMKKLQRDIKTKYKECK